jgi:hypothetical protein
VRSRRTRECRLQPLLRVEAISFPPHSHSRSPKSRYELTLLPITVMNIRPFPRRAKATAM